jgi:phosphomannomutase
VRTLAAEGLTALLRRDDWGDLRALFAQAILPRLAAAPGAPRSARMQACIEATTRLRSLAARPLGRPWAWRLRAVAEMQYPRFGTSGWRARMGQDFTWNRATAVAQAIVEFVIASGVADQPLAIGYDSRINADRVAALVAEVAVANGVNVHLASRETPSPALIFYITEELGVAHNAGLINCTPSHNPVKDPSVRKYLGTEYHGIRYNMPYGAVAPSRATDTIGRRAMELLLEDVVVPVDRPRGTVTLFDPLDAYVDAALDDLARSAPLDTLRAFWGADNAMVVIDELHSASRGYLRRACDKLGIRYTVLHGEKDPLLGELMYANPEPPHIGHCERKVADLRAAYPRIIGVGMDTDSDRFGVVDEHGRYLMMNQVLPMLADYLLTAGYNGRPGKIIRNMVTTRLLDRIAAAHPDKTLPPPDRDAIVIHAAASSYRVSLGDPKAQSGFFTFVVPVGFKFIADVMMGELQTALAAGEPDADRVQAVFHDCLQRLLIAGEESNGMTSRGHTPDKDGLWGALLTLQMCAVLGQTPQALWQRVLATYGSLVSVRRDVEAPDAAKEALVNVYLDRYAAGGAPDPLLAGFTPVYCGGVRGELVEIILHDAQGRESYVAVRASGTEPINRIYVESPDEAGRDALVLAVGQELERRIIAAITAAPEVNAVVDLLESVELPPADGRNLPATYTSSIIGVAVARIRELAGSQADVQLQLADAELGERNGAKAGTLCGILE